MAFVDKLIEMNRGDFLGGFNKLGQALKEKEQQDTLVEQWNRFKIERDELLTTHEQAAELSKDFLKESEKPTDVEMTANIFEHLQRNIETIGALTDLYQPFITSFATLGEDGVRVAERLTNELATKIAIEEKRGEIPFQQLEYGNATLNFRFNKEKFNDYITDRVTMEQTNEVTDWIISNSAAFKLIDGGKIITNDPAKLTKYNAQYGTLMKEISEQFGEANKGVLSNAIQLALARTGKSFTFNEDIYDNNRNMGNIKGYTSQDLQTYASFLRGWSQQWMGMNKEDKKTLQAYLGGNTGIITDQNRKWLEDNALIYGANGLYQQYESQMALIDPTYMKTKKNRYGNEEEYQDIEEPEETLILKSLGISSTKDIIRMLDSNTFKDDTYKYNPVTTMRLKALVEKNIENLKRGLPRRKEGQTDMEYYQEEVRTQEVYSPIDFLMRKE